MQMTTGTRQVTQKSERITSKEIDSVIETSQQRKVLFGNLKVLAGAFRQNKRIKLERKK